MKRSLLTLFVLTILGLAELSAQGKFSGYMFGDYFYNVARDSSFNRANPANSVVNGPKDLQAFQFRRIYLTYDNDISEQFTSRFRLEADQVSQTSDGKFAVAVKDAYLQWKNVFPGSNLIFGLSPTPAYDISEAAWGYRSLEKTIMDLRGIVGSRDLGIALRGRLDGEGMINYWIMVANNAGQKPETDKFKRFYLNIQVKPTKNLQFTAYADYAGAAEVNDPTSTTVPRATVSHATLTYAGFVDYKEPDKFNLGVEAFLRSTANGMVDPGATTGALVSLKTMGVSIFGSLNFNPELAAIARFDLFDPNSDSNVKGDARNYIIAGLEFKPNKNVSIIPNVQIETYQAPANGGPSIDPSVTGRVTFYYVFL